MPPVGVALLYSDETSSFPPGCRSGGASARPVFPAGAPRLRNYARAGTASGAHRAAMAEHASAEDPHNLLFLLTYFRLPACRLQIGLQTGLEDSPWARPLWANHGPPGGTRHPGGG